MKALNIVSADSGIFSPYNFLYASFTNSEESISVVGRTLYIIANLIPFSIFNAGLTIGMRLVRLFFTISIYIYLPKFSFVSFTTSTKASHQNDGRLSKLLT